MKNEALWKAVCFAGFLKLAFVSLGALTQLPVFSDIKPLMSVYGRVKSISDPGKLIITRTGIGPSGDCVVTLYGIKLPSSKAWREKAISFARKLYGSKPVLFRVATRTRTQFSAMVYLTKEDPDSPLNAALLIRGLATSTLKSDPSYDRCVREAKAKHLGIWSLKK